MSRLPVPFGNPRTYPGHSGVDYPQPRGTLIRASGPGVMGLRNTTTRGGVTAWVDYDGYPGVAYAHLDDYRHTPPRGTRVREGDVIGAVGMSGFTTGPHLHSEVNGHSTTAGYWRFFDPSRVVGQGSGAGGGSTPIPTPTPTRKKDAVTLYAENKSSPKRYALAGESPGTDANWIETTDAGLAGEWARVHGGAVALSAGSFASFRGSYLQPVRTVGV